MSEVSLQEIVLLTLCPTVLWPRKPHKEVYSSAKTKRHCPGGPCVLQTERLNQQAKVVKELGGDVFGFNARNTQEKVPYSPFAVPENVRPTRQRFFQNSKHSAGWFSRTRDLQVHRTSTVSGGVASRCGYLARKEDWNRRRQRCLGNESRYYKQDPDSACFSPGYGREPL